MWFHVKRCWTTRRGCRHVRSDQSITRHADSRKAAMTGRRGSSSIRHWYVKSNFTAHVVLFEPTVKGQTSLIEQSQKWECVPVASPSTKISGYPCPYWPAWTLRPLNGLARREGKWNTSPADFRWCRSRLSWWYCRGLSNVAVRRISSWNFSRTE